MSREPPDPPDPNKVMLKLLPPVLTELAQLLVAREKIRELDQAYCYALRVMRRCEQALIEQGVEQNWVGAVHSRADDWDRNRLRHLTAILEQATNDAIR
jgi:hypothetical protein